MNTVATASTIMRRGFFGIISTSCNSYRIPLFWVDSRPDVDNDDPNVDRRIAPKNVEK